MEIGLSAIDAISNVFNGAKLDLKIPKKIDFSD